MTGRYAQVLASFATHAREALDALAVPMADAFRGVIGRRQHAVDTPERTRIAAFAAGLLYTRTPEMALTSLARAVRTSVGVDRCEVHVRLPGAGVSLMSFGDPMSPGSLPTRRSGSSPCVPDYPRLLEWVVRSGRPVAACVDETMRFGEDGRSWSSVAAAGFCTDGLRTLLLPLLRHGRTIGVLALVHDGDFTLDAVAQGRLELFLRYAARGAERLTRPVGPPASRTTVMWAAARRDRVASPGSSAHAVESMQV